MSSKYNYGKLNQSDIEALFLLLPELEKERREFQSLVEQEPEKFSSKFLCTGFAWAHLYEVPISKLLTGFLAVTGLDGIVVEASKQVNPVKALFEVPDNVMDSTWRGGTNGKYTPGDLLGYLHAVAANMECLVLYGSYLNGFIEEARKGDLGALLKALRIDPSVVTGPTARNRLSVAVVAGDQGFINEVRKAMAGKTGKQGAYLKKFRFLMQVLHEAGALGLPTKEIMDLVFEVGAYDRGPGAQKNVSELILRAKALKRNTI